MSDKYSPSGLETLSDEGKPPKSRMSGFQECLSRVERLRLAGENRNLKATSLTGMLNGNPPFDPAELRRNNMGHYPNFSTLEGKAYHSAARVPYYDLFSSAPHHIEINLDVKDHAEQEQWSTTATSELHRLLCEPDQFWFETEMWKLLYDYCGFGKGFLIRPGTTTWKARHVKWTRVMLPNGTDVELDDWEEFVVLWNYTVHDLYRRVRNADKARSQGWFPDQVIRAIQSASGYSANNNRDWVDVQRQLNDNDLSADTQCESVQTAWYFVKEFDGRWTWMIVPLHKLMGLTKNIQRSDSDYLNDGFLYRKERVYESVQNIISPFFYEVDDGSVNGLSGLAKDIFVPMQLKDRLACAEVHNGLMRSSICIQARSGSSRANLGLIQLGNLTVIPEGVDVQQSTILGDIDSAIAIDQHLDRKLSANTGIWRPQFEKPSGNPEPLGTTQLRMMQGTVLQSSSVSRFQRQLDGFYSETYRRIVASGEEDARKWRQWCVERGVPEKALAKPRNVRAYRVTGNGSPFLRQAAIGSLMALAPEFPEDGRRNFTADAVAGFAGLQKVESYVRTRQAANIPDRHLWEANEENGTIKDGNSPVWTPDQDDNIHLAKHADALSQALQGIQQGADPAAVATFGRGIIAHAERDHIGSLQRKGRKEQIKAWGQVYQQLNQQVSQVEQMAHQQAKQQQQAQQRQQQISFDQQLDAQVATHKAQLSEMQKRHKMELTTEQTRHTEALATASAVADIHREDLKAAADIRRKDAKDKTGNGQ